MQRDVFTQLRSHAARYDCIHVVQASCKMHMLAKNNPLYIPLTLTLPLPQCFNRMWLKDSETCVQIERFQAAKRAASLVDETPQKKRIERLVAGC